MFAMAPDNLDAYDSVTVADQYQIGEAIAQNASDWVDATFPDAEDGSIDAVIIKLPTDAENIKRDEGMDTIANNPRSTWSAAMSSARKTPSRPRTPSI